MSLKTHTPPPPVPVKPSSWLQELAYDIALEYHTPEEVRDKYGLSEPDYDRILQSVPVKRAISAYRRMIDEETTQARLKTKRLASLLIEELGAMAMDRSMDPATRLKAIEAVCRYAELDKPPANQAAANTAPFTINIQVNQ